MLNNKVIKLGLVALAAVVFLSSSEAHAQRHGRHGGRAPARHHGPSFKFGPSIKIGPVKLNIPKPVVKVAPRLNFLYTPPRNYALVKAGGITYYRAGNIYYRRVLHQGNYVYLQADPAAATVAQVQPSAHSNLATFEGPLQPTNKQLDQIVVYGKVYSRPKENTSAAKLTSAGASAKVVLAQHTTERPEIGSTVNSLPRTTEARLVGATTYYVSDHSHYLPIKVGQATKFVVVENPGK